MDEIFKYKIMKKSFLTKKILYIVLFLVFCIGGIFIFNASQDGNNELVQKTVEKHESQKKKILVFLGEYDHVETVLQKYSVDIDYIPFNVTAEVFDKNIYKNIQDVSYLKQFDIIVFNSGFLDQVFEAHYSSMDEGKNFPAFFYSQSMQKPFRDYVYQGGVIYATGHAHKSIPLIFDYDQENSYEWSLDNRFEPTKILIKLTEKFSSQVLSETFMTNKCYSITNMQSIHKDASVLLSTTLVNTKGVEKNIPILSEFSYGKGQVVMFTLHNPQEVLKETKKIMEEYKQRVYLNYKMLDSYRFFIMESSKNMKFNYGPSLFAWNWSQFSRFHLSHTLLEGEALSREVNIHFYEAMKNNEGYFKIILPKEVHVLLWGENKIDLKNPIEFEKNIPMDIKKHHDFALEKYNKSQANAFLDKEDVIIKRLKPIVEKKTQEILQRSQEISDEDIVKLSYYAMAFPDLMDKYELEGLLKDRCLFIEKDDLLDELLHETFTTILGLELLK